MWGTISYVRACRTRQELSFIDYLDGVCPFEVARTRDTRRGDGIRQRSLMTRNGAGQRNPSQVDRGIGL